MTTNDVVTRAKHGEGSIGHRRRAGRTRDRSQARRIVGGGDKEEVEGESSSEVRSGSEGEERRSVAGGRGERGDTAPERERATSNTAVHKTRTARAKGSLIEGEELVRRDHCRGCALRVWVASQVARVQVHKDEGSIAVLLPIVARLMTKGNGGR